MRLTRHLAAAALVAAAAGPLTLGLTLGLAAPAGSATCADAAGVSVVVDFKGLGGGVQSVCDTDGGGQKASSLFTGNGFELTYAQRTPGFVCRIEGKPASDPCVNTAPANAYWGLWWSDGTNGKWSYSSLGAGSLTIPAGGSVAFAWDGVDGSATPGVAPPKKAAAPSPTASPTPAPTPSATPEPTRSPTTKPTPTPTTQESVAATPTPTTTLAPTDTATPTPSASQEVSLTPTPSESVTSEGTAQTPSESPGDDLETTSAPTDGDGSLPLWVPIVVIVLLFGAAAALVVRRRAGPPGPTGA